jgi:hypothetical protein
MVGKMAPKPILVLDFDGVLHRYDSGWKGPTIITDPPTPGMVPFLRQAVDIFDVQILSSRTKYPGGVDAMKKWLTQEVQEYYDCVYHTGAPRDFANAQAILTQVKFPEQKPAAFLTIDDRAITFNGKWPDIETLKNFEPWNKKSTPNKEQSPSTGIIRRALTFLSQEMRKRKSK